MQTYKTLNKRIETMDLKKKKIYSKRDGLELELAILEPSSPPKGIVQISHGMAEHKERYFDFMKFYLKMDTFV